MQIYKRIISIIFVLNMTVTSFELGGGAGGSSFNSTGAKGGSSNKMPVQVYMYIKMNLSKYTFILVLYRR